MPTIALIGNPNAGKTSLFNALTGARQKVGNYAGVTVEKIDGRMNLNGQEILVTDIPGLYSLTPVSTDEEVALEALGNQDSKPDVLVYVLDASNLERNLFLFSQLADISTKVVVALTLTDVLERGGHAISLPVLSSHLGCEVVPVIAHKGIGIELLKEAIQRSLDDGLEGLELDVGFPEIVMNSADRIVDHMNRRGVAMGRREARCVLLDEHCTTSDRFRELPELWAIIDEERRTILGTTAQAKTLDAQARYAWASKVKRDCLTSPEVAKRSKSDLADRFLTHRFFGLVFFLGLMYLVFQSIYTFAAPLMDLIDVGKSALVGAVAPGLESMPMIQSLVVDGVIEGIGAAVVFLPQIMILFFFIAVLEGTGYLARAAFLMDKLLGWCGLNGRAFIPLLSSFACAVPGIMSARVMPDQKSRLLTVMVAPLMSCSARLPVYLLLIGAVIEPKYGPVWGGIALFAMHFIGLLIAIPVVAILNKGVIKGTRLPFMLELPKYQWPKWKDVILTVFSRAKVFLQTAGTIIFAMSVLIWAALYFPQGDVRKYQTEYDSLTVERQEMVSFENYSALRQREESALGRFGKSIEPVFKPAGFDWRLTTAILAAFPAREVVVPAMGILFGTGGDVDGDSPTLREKMLKATWPDGRPLIDIWTAISLMVFFALCAQCMATLAAIKRETNSWKWAALSFTYMTVLAYVAAILVQTIGKLVGT